MFMDWAFDALLNCFISGLQPKIREWEIIRCSWNAK